MKDSYEAYVKEVNGIPLYFVKHFLVFPEYSNIDPLVQGYGMHADFEKACNIAGILDPAIRKSIFPVQSTENTDEAKLVDISVYRAQKRLSR